MKHWPLIPTIVVGLAVATMIGLGIWQLQRAAWKRDLIASHQRAASLPPVSFPNVPVKDGAPLYRRATGFCLQVVGWGAAAGRSARGESGWRHTASCRTGYEGPGMRVDLGWSRDSTPPKWTGGAVTGVIVPDASSIVRLAAAAPVTGLQPLAAPDPADAPNNHLAYAIQWFLFAAAAALIYWLALRRRLAAKPPAP